MKRDVFNLCGGFLNYSSFARIKALHKNPPGNKSASVRGWIKSIRKLKNNLFIDVSDGSSSKVLQVVVPKEKFEGSLSYGSSVIVHGKITTNPNNQIELLAEDIDVLGKCDLDEYPFRPKKAYSNEYIRQHLHLRFRTKGFSSLLRVRNEAANGLNDFFQKQDFLNIHTPILTSNDCEGAGEVFSVVPDSKSMLSSMNEGNLSAEEIFFDNKVYLTVSGQLHLEAAARGLGNVYSFGPTFRAENSKSRLHLSEFYMAEAETAFVSSVEEITSLAEGLIKHITEFILNKCSEDVQCCRECVSDNQKPQEYLENFIDQDFTIMSYKEAVDIIQKNNDKLSSLLSPNDSFSKEHELFLVKYNSYKPIFIVEWPSSLKPFYMKQHPQDPNKVVAFDLLSDVVGELCGGSVRENDYNILQSSLKKNLLLDKLKWYLDLRKYGNVITGGFGLGFERYLQALLNITNIKDVIPFPRWPHNCKM